MSRRYQLDLVFLRFTALVFTIRNFSAQLDADRYALVSVALAFWMNDLLPLASLGFHPNGS